MASDIHHRYPLYSLFKSMILPQKRFSICLQRCAKNRSMAGGRVKCYGAFFGSRGVFEFVRKVPWEAHICCKCRLVGKRFSTGNQGVGGFQSRRLYDASDAR